MNRVKQGYDFGHYKIDEHLRFKRGNFNIILGHNNVGKTTVILFLMVLQSVNNNLKWLVFSSENTPESIAIKIIQFYLGKPINKVEEDELQKAMMFMMGHFIIMDADKKMYSYRDLIEEATDINNEEGIDGFLIDPYNSLKKEPKMYQALGGHEYDYEVATAFRNWAKQQKVSIWVNTHAVTSALRNKYPKDHEYAGMTKPPSVGDVEGGGKWGNRADDMWIIDRLISHPSLWMYTHIHCVKVKETETGGKPTPYEEPIQIRMKPGSAGFELDGESLLATAEKVQGDFPF
tara:strand:+ start:2896 stop:3765 length:870 start_codon:yes stop_codon:yes gene_type:complete